MSVTGLTDATAVEYFVDINNQYTTNAADAKVGSFDQKLEQGR